MQTEFLQRAGYLAELPGAEEILNGTFVPELGMDPYAVQFLSHLKKGNSCQYPTTHF
jgi:hypothetical protein